MNSKKVAGTSDETAKYRIEHEAEGAAAGAFVGGVVGVAAGPVGLVAGAVIGSVAGALAGAMLDQDASERQARTRELDAAIGVTEGNLGAPNLKHPPAKVGAYSGASVGQVESRGDVAEGPIQASEA
jgi:phage tail tape-measure protein